MSVASYCTRARIYPSRREHLTSAINSYCVWLTRPNQEVSDRHRVKVEHLSAGQFSIAHLIEAEDRCVQPFPIGAETSLSPDHDDLSVGGRHDARLHLLLRRGGLERHPCLGPPRPIAAEALRDAAIRQGRGPVKLDILVTKSEHPLGVAALDCAKNLEHQFGVLFGVHGGPSFDKGSAFGRRRRRPFERGDAFLSNPPQLLERIFDGSRSATFPPLVQALSVDAHLVGCDVLWTDALLVQEPRDRFWRIHLPRDVDALALPHDIAMRFRDRLETVPVEHRTHPRGVAFSHFVDAKGEGQIDLLFGGETREQRMLRGAGATAFMEHEIRPEAIGHPPVWQRPEVLSCLAKCWDSASEEQCRRVPRGLEGDIWNGFSSNPHDTSPFSHRSLRFRCAVRASRCIRAAPR